MKNVTQLDDVRVFKMHADRLFDRYQEGEITLTELSWNLTDHVSRVICGLDILEKHQD